MNFLDIPQLRLPTHFALKNINAKKHLLIEKPMTLKLSDAEELVKISEKNSVGLMVGHLMHSPSYYKN